MWGCHLNYQFLAIALEYYKNKSYKYIDVPWIVPGRIDNITRPEEAQPLEVIIGGNLIGSGEQGFITLLDMGQLPKGKYVCVTPCFRDGPLDELHQTTFMKVELFITPKTSELSELLQTARDLYRIIGIPTKILQTGDESFDIVEFNSEIELGSYGHRSFMGNTWTYGTGLAEPRTSFVLNRFNEMVDTKVKTVWDEGTPT